MSSIDGLRVAAALAVVLYHMQSEGHVSVIDHQTLSAVVVPVFAVFFVVSGFVLYQPWATAHLAASPGQRHIRSPDGGIGAFYFRRALRLYPVYWTVLIFALVTEGADGVHGVGDWVQMATLSPLPNRDLLFTHGIGLIVWTLMVDLGFYLVLPIWGRATSRLISWGATPLIAEVAPITVAAIAFTAIAQGTHLALGAFGLVYVGMLLAVAAGWQSTTRRPVPVLQRLADKPWQAVALAAGFGAIGMLLAQGQEPGTLFNNNVWLRVGAVALVIPAAFGPARSLYNRVLSSKGARLGAPITYGIYLWHYPIRRVIGDAVPASFFPLLLTVFPLTLQAAVATNRLIERPVDGIRRRRFGARVASPRSPGRDATGSAVATSATNGSGNGRRKAEPDTDEPAPAAASPAISAGSWCAPLTGFRAIAAVLVVVGHTFLSARTYPFTGVIHVIGLVVPSFFVISAYALYRPFVMAHVRGEPARSARSFWWRRALRIYPLYALALTAYLILLPDLRPHGGHVVDYAKLYGFLQVYDKNLVNFSGIPAAWFLCDEVAFYLAIPLIAMLAAAWARRRRASTVSDRLRPHLMIAGAFFVLGPFVRAVLVLRNVPGATSLPISNLDFYGLGILLAVLSIRERSQLPIPAPVDWLRRRPPVAFAITTVALVTLAWVAKKPDQLFDPHETVIRYALWTVAAVPLMTYLLLGVQDRGANKWLSAPRFFWLSVLSLHIYLWHQLLLGAFDRYVTEIADVRYGPRFTTIAVLAAVMVVATVGLSALLRPVLDLAYRRWSKRFDVEPAVTGTAAHPPVRVTTRPTRIPGG